MCENYDVCDCLSLLGMIYVQQDKSALSNVSALRRELGHTKNKVYKILDTVFTLVNHLVKNHRQNMGGGSMGGAMGGRGSSGFQQQTIKMPYTSR